MLIVQNIEVLVCLHQNRTMEELKGRYYDLVGRLFKVS